MLTKPCIDKGLIEENFNTIKYRNFNHIKDGLVSIILTAGKVIDV